MLNWAERVRILAVAIVLISIGSSAAAEIDDKEFNQCMALYSHDPDVYKGQVWYITPIEADVQKLLDPQFVGDRIVRWTEYKSNNGNLTFIVLERGTDPYEENEQDALHIITKIQGIVENKDWFAVDAVVFGKSTKEGMPSIIPCREGLGPKEERNGHNRG